MNLTLLTGNLCADIETKYTPNGTPVAECNLAVDCGTKDKPKTGFFGLVFWGKTAETAEKYLGKGSKILVQGRLDQSEWEDKDTGKKRQKTRVIVDRFEFMGAKRDDRNDREKAESTPHLVEHGGTVEGGDEDDIPF